MKIRKKTATGFSLCDGEKPRSLGDNKKLLSWIEALVALLIQDKLS
jgi:hypothetical protein